MNRFASIVAYAGTVTAAALSSVALMSSSALAETPTIDTTPFVSTLSRAEVRDEVLRARRQSGDYGTEWAMQLNEQHPIVSGLTRAKVMAEYLDARDLVAAINSEDSGSAYFAQARMRGADGSTMVAHSPTQ